MKRFICLVLIICLAVPVLGGTLAEDRKTLKQLEIEIEKEHATEVEIERKVERLALTIIAGINLGMCLWGAGQNSTYGTVTGIFFGFRFGGNMMAVAERRNE